MLKTKFQILFITLFLISLNSQAQWDKWRYSGLFDSYYKQEFKYSVGPTFAYLSGDLGNSSVSPGFGASVEMKVLPGVEVSTGLRYFKMSASDHDAERQLDFCGDYFQHNLLGRFFFIHDKIKSGQDRQTPSKFIHAYITTGLSLMYYYANPTRYGFEYSTKSMAVSALRANIPVGLGVSFKLGEHTRIIPEALYYATLTDRIDGIISMTNLKDHFGLFNIRFEHNIADLSNKVRSWQKKCKLKRRAKNNTDSTIEKTEDESTL